MKHKYLLWAIAGVAALGALSAWYYPRVDQFSDIFFYEKISADVASVRGGTAPGEPAAWYPPFAATVFYGIGRIPSLSYVQAWLVFVVCAVAAATAYMYWVLKEQRAYLLPLAILLCFFLIGNNVAFARYDIVIGLCVVLGYLAFRAKHYASSIVFVVLAGGLKAVPFIVLPALLLIIPRTRMRSIWIGLAVGIVLIVGMPALLIGPNNFIAVTKAFVSFQGQRGFQIESTLSGVDMFAKNLANQRAYAAFHHFATHNMDLGAGALKVVTVLVALGLLYIYWRIWKNLARSELDAGLVFAACIAWMLFIAPVFSPQFLMWLIPLMLIWIGLRVEEPSKPSPAVRNIAIIVAFICVATQWIYPWHYREFFEQTYLFNTIMLNMRNLAVGVLAALSLRALGIRFHAPLRKLFKRPVTFLSQETAPLTATQKKIASYVMIAIVVGFVGYICSFKILDRDFWWHVKAGEVMTQTKSLIQTEPFAYTRAGQPYLATQSWLAEVALYEIHHAFGTNGIIVFRTLSMIVVFGALLAMNKKHMWLTTLFVILAANSAQPAFIERPQLFTFMLFAIFVALALRVLERGLSVRLAATMLGVEILWVNMHGAAAFLGIFIVVCLALQRAYVQREKFQWKPWAYLGIGMVLAFFVSPSGYYNITYMFQLLSDKTIVFIEEWQPRPLAVYLGEMGVLWIAAVWSLWSTRRNWVFCTALLVGVGFLSLRALRHEVLFVIAAVGITIYQLHYSKRFERFAQYLATRQMLAGLLLLISVFGLLRYTKNHYQNFAQQDQLFGYGAFTPAKGAYNFIEKHDLQGNMFNTYGIGGYLLNRGYPERKVYIDGRNVDYGFEFMNATYEGGLDGEHWKLLEDKYNLSYAIIDYMAIAKVGRAGYSVHLDKNPNWKLVYLDDWTGVYVKNIPENQDVIRASTYSLLTPINIDKGEVLDMLTVENKDVMIQELRRVIDGNTDGVKARILLARIYMADRKLSEARTLLGEVKNIQPHLADTYQLLAGIAHEEQQEVESITNYRTMLKHTGKAYPDINYRAIADVFTKAGHPFRAAYYRWLAKPEINQQTLGAQGNPLSDDQVLGDAQPLPSDGPITQDTIGDLFAGIAADLQKNNDEGVALAQQRKFPEAKEMFMEALKLDPGNPQTLNNLGVLFLETGDEAAALDYLKRALERTDEYADAHYNLGILYYRQQKYQDALKEAELAQKYGRDNKSLLEAIQGKLK